jgi:transposase
MMEKSIKSVKHRKYDQGFKDEALRMVSSGRSVPEVARVLGIGENVLYNWRASEKAKMPVEEKAEKAELEQLRKQVKSLETERDILKKALLIFGRGT